MNEQTNLLSELERDLDRELSPLAARMAPEPNPLLPQKVQLERIEEEFRAKAKAFREKSAKGLEFCLTKIEEMALSDETIKPDELKESLKKAYALLESKENIQIMASQAVQESSWKELLAIPSPIMGLLYRAAKNLLELRQYEQAECAFTHLILLDPGQYCFWLGLGAALFGLQNYDESLNAYKVAMSLEPQEVWPLLFQADCLEMRRDFAGAKDLLQRAALLYKGKATRDLAIESRLMRGQQIP